MSRYAATASSTHTVHAGGEHRARLGAGLTSGKGQPPRAVAQLGGDIVEIQAGQTGDQSADRDHQQAGLEQRAPRDPTQVGQDLGQAVRADGLVGHGKAPLDPTTTTEVTTTWA